MVQSHWYLSPLWNVTECTKPKWYKIQVLHKTNQMKKCPHKRIFKFWNHVKPTQQHKPWLTYISQWTELLPVFFLRQVSNGTIFQIHNISHTMVLTPHQISLNCHPLPKLQPAVQLALIVSHNRCKQQLLSLQETDSGVATGSWSIQ